MSFHKLKGVDNIGEFGPSELVAENVIRFFDWGFVNAGGFTNVEIPASSIYGGDKDALRLRYEENYADGQVWEAGRKNWVWESGVLVDEQPIQISGVYVDSIFYPTNSSGTYAHHYDYERGRVIFDNAIDNISNVQLEYSYKYITVVDAYTIPFYQRLQQDGFTFLDSMTASGDILVSGENRLQLPVVAIEIPPIQSSRGYELGSGARTVSHTIVCHVISSHPNTNRKIGDIIADQANKTLWLYDTNTVVASGDYPLDYRGMTIDNYKTYPQLCYYYPWTKMWITNTSNSPQITRLNDKTYVSAVRLRTELILNSV